MAACYQNRWTEVSSRAHRIGWSGSRLGNAQQTSMKLSRLRPITKTLYLSSAVAGAATLGFAQDATKFENLSKENEGLRKRLDALEAMAQKEGLVPSGKP